MTDLSGRPFGQPALAASPSSPMPGLAPSGFDQAYMGPLRKFAAMDAAFAEMLDHGLNGGPEYDLARDRFNALKESVRDQARLS